MSLAFMPFVWLLLALPAIVFIIRSQFRRQPMGTLVIVEQGETLHGRWHVSSGAPAALEPVSCHYLGPWLLGLDVGGERLWLWPDNLPGHSHRSLRRLLHRPGHRAEGKAPKSRY